jgi:hypothetical protein
VNDTVYVEGAVLERMLMAELIPILEANAPPAAEAQRRVRTS